ncbi:hypothetical protein C8R46DRAFT_1206741 [Mycena filopes]|nr:hypothetical protein C8R46DRAFT_1206741 [Mycena filopes]
MAYKETDSATALFTLIPLCPGCAWVYTLFNMQTTVVDRPVSGVMSSELAPKPQNLLDAEAELYRLFLTYMPPDVQYEFNPAVLHPFVPKTDPEFCTSAVQRHDRQYGVTHYRIPSSGFSLPQYPTSDQKDPYFMMGLVPIAPPPSFASQVFAFDPDDVPEVTVCTPAPNPWTFPIEDVPVGITPQSVLIRPIPPPISSRPASGQAPQPRPIAAASPSRPTIKLPAHAQTSATAPRSLAPSPSHPPSDYYSAPQGGNAKKRKPLNLPVPRSPKKSVVARALNPPSARPRKALVHSRQHVSCTGCPAVFGAAPGLQIHLTNNAHCTSRNAAQVLQAFYLQPEVIALSPSTPQDELMAYWEAFLGAVAVHVAQQKERN